MLRSTASIVAVGLITLFAIPGESFAGPFGLFHRHRTQPKCCPVVECCPVASPAVVEVAAPTVTEVPVSFEVTCYAKVFGINNATGYYCYASGSATGNSADCEGVRAAAVQNAMDAAEAAGCTVQGTPYVYCNPQCPVGTIETRREPSTGCAYKVTYKICCCDGQLIDVPYCSEDLGLAKYAAKIIACSHASESGCRIRWCRWQICRVAHCD